MTYCRTCFDAARRHFPAVNESDVLELLFSATAYPLAGCEETERQLVALKEAGCVTVQDAAIHADDQTWKAMEAAGKEADER